MPEAIPLAVELLLFAAVFVLIGLTKGLQYSLVALLKGIASAAHRIPFVGGTVAGKILALSDYIYHELGIGILALEHVAVRLWRVTALLVRETGKEIAALAGDVEIVLHYLRYVELPYWVQRGIIAALRASGVISAGQSKAIAAQVAKATHADAITPRIIAQEDARTRQAVAGAAAGIEVALPGGAVNFRKLLRGLAAATGAAYLAALGVRVLDSQIPWRKCSNVKRSMRHLCGMPRNLLNDLLALTADFFILTNICRVIPWLEVAFEEVATPLISQLARAGAGLCGAGYAPTPPLAVPELNLPPSAGTQLYLS